MAKKHKHIFEVRSWSGKDISYQCTKCDEWVVRKMTKKELAHFNKKHLFHPSRDDNIHYVWHKLVNALGKDWEENTIQDAKINLGGICGRFAKRFPETVTALRCDDSYHASSDLILISHEAKRSWMGVTVLMFPQCDGRPPAQFFLYENHIDDLIKTLTKIRKRSKQKLKLEEKDNKLDTQWWNKQINKLK